MFDPEPVMTALNARGHVGAWQPAIMALDVTMHGIGVNPSRIYNGWLGLVSQKGDMMFPASSNDLPWLAASKLSQANHSQAILQSIQSGKALHKITC